ncbi:Uncharacterised protein [Mobiluncus holmesii]|nr:Uncharacterised protein [Mobiluncus holmesii]
MRVFVITHGYQTSIQWQNAAVSTPETAKNQQELSPSSVLKSASHNSVAHRGQTWGRSGLVIEQTGDQIRDGAAFRTHQGGVREQGRTFQIFDNCRDTVIASYPQIIAL